MNRSENEEAMTTVDMTMMPHQEVDFGDAKNKTDSYSEYATHLHMTMQIEPLALDLLFQDFAADVVSSSRQR